MWLCNVFTILMCLVSVDNCDTVQQHRYGAIVPPPRVKDAEPNRTDPTAVATRFETDNQR